MKAISKCIYNSVIENEYRKHSSFLKKFTSNLIDLVFNDYSDRKRVLIPLPKQLYWKGPEIRDEIAVQLLPYDDCDDKGQLLNILDGSRKNEITIYPQKIIEGYKKNTSIDVAINNTIKSLHLDGMTQLNKATVIHDYVCKKMHYCNEHRGSGSHDMKHLSATISELIFGNCCVCNGYAQLYKILCNKAGIKCAYVSNDNHAWNRVYISGKYYFVDCTWDDNENGPISTKYLLKLKKEFTQILKHPFHTQINRLGWEI